MSDEVKARPFPMLRGPSIPRPLAEIIYRAYHALHPGQSFARLAERGGFGWTEVGLLFENLKRRNHKLHDELIALYRTPALSDAMHEEMKADCSLCGGSRHVADNIDPLSYPETAPFPKCSDGEWAYRALLKRCRTPALSGEVLVERVARAMLAVSRPNADPDAMTAAPRGQLGSRRIWQLYEPLAQAALSAMRSGEVVEAAARAIAERRGSKVVQHFHRADAKAALSAIYGDVSAHD